VRLSRSVDHKYTATDDDGTAITVPGTTDILKVLDKSDALMAWSANNTADAAIELARRRVTDAYSALDVLLEVVGPEGVHKALTSRSAWQRDSAAALGSRVHGWADKLLTVGLTAEDMASMDDGTLKRVKTYAKWWSESGWTLRLTEALVYNPEVGYGGTFDLLAYDAEGKTVLADLKTGASVYREAILQLAAYGMAPLVQPAGGERTFIAPKPDRYVVLHVLSTKVNVKEVHVGEAETMAFLDCVDLYRWLQKTAGRL
jgi:hypothetical protein